MLPQMVPRDGVGDDGGRGAILSEAIKEGLTEEVTFELGLQG